ncbi:hypothetical protein [Streptomyces sp. NPDC060333]|uniref:hypothetical protein n=1 Tax=Streptomyces sp. NPDC060333 TaxID=3347098 RepID=UPI003646F8F3
MDDIREGSGCEADRQEHDQGGDAQPGGQDLGADREQHGEREPEEDLVIGHGGAPRRGAAMVRATMLPPCRAPSVRLTPVGPAEGARPSPEASDGMREGRPYGRPVDRFARSEP